MSKGNLCVHRREGRKNKNLCFLFSKTILKETNSHFNINCNTQRKAVSIVVQNFTNDAYSNKTWLTHHIFQHAYFQNFNLHKVL